MEYVIGQSSSEVTSHFQYAEVERFVSGFFTSDHRSVVSHDSRLFALRHLCAYHHIALRLSGSSRLFVYRHHHCSVGTYLECVVPLSHGGDNDYA